MQEQHDRVEQLRPKLRDLREKWRAITVEYAGDGPPPYPDLVDWDLVDWEDWTSADGDPAAARLSFTRAWHDATTASRELLVTEFPRWASEVASTLGIPCDPSAVPEPPVRVPGPPTLPCDRSELATITGTGDVVEGGLRLIFWAAAYCCPDRHQRDSEHCHLYWRWAGQFAQFDAPYPPEFPSGCCYARPHFLFDWVERAFESLLGQPTEEEREDAPEPTAPGRFAMEKRDDRTIDVSFATSEGYENGLMTGRNAFRLQKLIAQGRIDVQELGGDLEAAAASRSIVSPSEFEGYEVGEAPFSRPGREGASLEDLRPLNDRMQEIDAELESAMDCEREKMEEERDQILEEVARLKRRETSSTRKARGRVERGFRSLRNDLFNRMPQFAQHVEQFVHYESVRDQYVYDPPICPPWKFHGFE